ncbi:MAG: pyridoxamine 5'-phosphate oxidase family protein [Pseudomonadales bacterium]|nr:MAG: pyridoxamine 5'-phosphate oxidase family protein [Pseudomonadales bacterium]
MTDSMIVKDWDSLRQILGEPVPGIKDKVESTLKPLSREFIQHAPLVFVSTVDQQGRLDVSPKGDAPGFCHIADDSTLLVPERVGNRLAFGFQNILQTGRIGLIFVIPRLRETLRVNGSAELTNDPDLLHQLSAQNKSAILCTRVSIEEVFLHCGKAMIRSKLWQPEAWAPTPNISWGQYAREKSLDNQATVEEAEKIAVEVDKVAEDNYKNELY